MVRNDERLKEMRGEDCAWVPKMRCQGPRLLTELFLPAWQTLKSVPASRP